jgi:hypothetical protein
MTKAQKSRRGKYADTIDWLLEGDPAIRWQTLRDLVGADARTVARERKRVASEGWGARLLEEQNARGEWARGQSGDGGMYVPKWTSTTYTLLLLRDLGLESTNAQAANACTLLLGRGLQPDGGIAYGPWAKANKRGETCITGMVLSILSHFGCDDDRLATVATHLVNEQMDDGGWNCRRASGATHSSMNTTISVLEALRLYERRGRKLRAIRAAQQRGREFLLVHRLFRSHRTGRVIKSEFLRFAFPPQWHYDVLRALDHFSSAGAPRDKRLAEGIELIRKRRRADGRWPLEYKYAGKTYFDMERVGEPSRWNTLRALRVLSWWDPRELTR